MNGSIQELFVGDLINYLCMRYVEDNIEAGFEQDEIQISFNSNTAIEFNLSLCSYLVSSTRAGTVEQARNKVFAQLEDKNIAPAWFVFEEYQFLIKNVAPHEWPENWHWYQNFLDHLANHLHSYSGTDILDFGRHRFSSVSEVCEVDPTYLQWMINKLKYFILEKKDEEILMPQMAIAFGGQGEKSVQLIVKNLSLTMQGRRKLAEALSVNMGRENANLGHVRFIETLSSS